MLCNGTCGCPRIWNFAVVVHNRKRSMYGEAAVPRDLDSRWDLV